MVNIDPRALTKAALVARAASIASAGAVRNFPPLATPPRRWLGSENGPVLGGAPDGPLVSRTIVAVRVPSRLSTSCMVPRGAVHEIMPPMWPHTPHNCLPHPPNAVIATASSPARGPCMVRDAGASPLQV